MKRKRYTEEQIALRFTNRIMEAEICRLGVAARGPASAGRRRAGEPCSVHSGFAGRHPATDFA